MSHVTSHAMDPRQVTLPSTWRSSTPSMILGKRPTIRGVLSSMISYSLRAGDPVAIWILQRRIPVCFLTTGCRDQHGRRLFLGSSQNGILLRAGGWFLVNAAPGPLELNLCSDGPKWTSDISCFARQYSTVFSASQRLVQASKRLMSYESVSSDSTLPRHLELCLVGPPYFHYHNEVR